MGRFWRGERLRDWLVQAVALIAVAGLLAGFILTARENLVAQGIATGFGFLGRSTGWPINFSLIEITGRDPYWRMLLAGMLNTLIVGGLGLIAASAIGLLTGLARISSNFTLNLAGTVYVEVFRNVPLILQVVFWYTLLTHLPVPREAIALGGFGFLSNRGLVLPAPEPSGLGLLILAAGVVAAVFGVRRLSARIGRWKARIGAAMGAGLLLTAVLLTGYDPGGPLLSSPELRGLRFVGGFTIKPEFAALLTGIAVFGGAYIGEIVRGGFLAVDPGRIEAAAALGLRPGQINLLVRFPLALRAMLPALANQYVWLMKATTLGIAIGYPDYFMVVSTSINQSGQTIELLALLMGGFLLINYAIAAAMNALNARLALKGRN
jgi:His/Glu/Gln/Arg/opine family amino acid ABC transporter permease subunit